MPSFSINTIPSHPAGGKSLEEVILVFVAKGSLVGRAHGLGFTGKVKPEDIEHVEEFYFQRQSTAQVDVCPYADVSLFESLKQRGFQVVEFCLQSCGAVFNHYVS